MKIHQLSVSYLHEHDRILVRINTPEAHEIRLWLTRRLCQGWAPVLRNAVDHLAAAGTQSASSALPARMDFAAAAQRQQSLRDADFETPFKSDSQSWPLGREPLLVTTVHIAPGKDGGMEMRFEESLADAPAAQRSFQAVLAPKLLHGFVHLLEQALESAQWDAPERGTRLPAMAGEAEDLFQRESPKYLH